MDERQPPREDPVWNTGVGGSHDDDPAAELASMGIITVGDLLTTSARAVASSFVPFVVIAVLVQLPSIAVSVATQEWLVHRTTAVLTAPYGGGSPLDTMSVILVVTIGAVFVQTIFTFLAQATLMYATVEFMAGRRASVGESLAGGFGNIGTILALSILNTLAIGLATMACVIPGVIVTCMLFASVPAAVCERLGPIEAMQRSADLTSGHRLTIFAALLVLGLVWFTFSCTAGIAVQAGDLVGQGLWRPLSARIIDYALDWVLAILLTIFQAALAGVFYARVRGVRDGVDADAIARVFE